MDECPASAPVAVDEGVDGFELSMGDGGLGECRERVFVAKTTEVLEKGFDFLVGRRDKRGRARVVTAPPDPVLLCPNLPGMLGEAGAIQEASVNLQETVKGDGLLSGEGVQRPGHGLDVAEDLIGGDIPELSPRILAASARIRRRGPTSNPSIFDEATDSARSNNRASASVSTRVTAPALRRAIAASASATSAATSPSRVIRRPTRRSGTYASYSQD